MKEETSKKNKILKDSFQSENTLQKKSIEEIYLNRSGLNQTSGEKMFLWFVIILISLLFGFGYFGIWSYNQERKKATEKEKPSISEAIVLAQSEGDENAKKEDINKEVEADFKKEENKEIAPEDVNVMVLNGGASAGSAGKVATFLKNNKYEKAEAGNTEGDYTGTTVFYKEGYSEAAAILLAVLKKDYPKAEIKEAKTNEEKVGSLVVVLGK